MSVGRKDRGQDLCDLLEMGAERKGRPQQVFFCRAEGETGGLNLEARKEGR